MSINENMHASSQTLNLVFIEALSINSSQSLLRKTYPHEELQHFVGMEEDIEKLASLLVSDQEISHHGVIGVWGMGGSGKTSVAYKVYKNVDVKKNFDLFAWVCISQKCQIQSVIQDIFRQLLPEKKKDMNVEDGELVEQIYKVQMETRCLIVIDDIWKLDDWKCLTKCFPISVGISHSKVLLTTRNKKVAEIGYPIQLKGITEDEAWELLRMKAFAKIHFKGKKQICGGEFKTSNARTNGINSPINV
ncbi:putative disease resistance protein At1g50180 isoform X4 [Henckelia pumila]|uniref:putative disease resistance protein At1g50180 isoform X4 n=1 Tax=Henckelia pumila TaxID=405737 RepID=UPI003C6DC0F9